jgi:DNA-binding transcriptional MerR regulator
MTQESSPAEAGFPDVPQHDQAARGKSIFTIGDIAREFGVTLRALRFYEDKGLLHPHRDGLNRLYSRRDRARLKLILMGKRVGFSLVEIKEMLDLYDLKDGQLTQLKVARDKFANQLGALEAQRVEVERAIAELTRTLEIVSGMVREREATAAASTQK